MVELNSEWFKLVLLYFTLSRQVNLDEKDALPIRTACLLPILPRDFDGVSLDSVDFKSPKRS